MTDQALRRATWASFAFGASVVYVIAAILICGFLQAIDFEKPRAAWIGLTWPKHLIAATLIAAHSERRNLRELDPGEINPSMFATRPDTGEMCWRHDGPPPTPFRDC